MKNITTFFINLLEFFLPNKFKFLLKKTPVSRQQRRKSERVKIKETRKQERLILLKSKAKKSVFRRAIKEMSLLQIFCIFFNVKVSSVKKSIVNFGKNLILFPYHLLRTIVLAFMAIPSLIKSIPSFCKFLYKESRSKIKKRLLVFRINMRRHKRGIIAIFKQIPKDGKAIYSFLEVNITLGIAYLVETIIPVIRIPDRRRLALSSFSTNINQFTTSSKDRLITSIATTTPKRWIGFAMTAIFPLSMFAQNHNATEALYSPVLLGVFIVTFVVGLALVVFEEKLHYDKEAAVLGTAFFMGMMLWSVPELLINLDYLSDEVLHHFKEDLSLHENLRKHLVHRMEHHTFKIAEIIFFLMAVMGAVTIAAKWGALKLMSNALKSENIYVMLFRLAVLSFLGSALFDNLANTILMITIMKELIPEQSKELRLKLGAFIVIMANAGGAFSPIGDVTTTMLWVGKQVSTMGILYNVIIPSIIVGVVTLFYFALKLKHVDLRSEYALAADNEAKEKAERNARGGDQEIETTLAQKKTMLITLILAIILIPTLKMLFHLPSPFYAGFGAIFMVWTMSEILDRRMVESHGEGHNPHGGHRKAMASLHDLHSNAFYFFTAILFAVAFLEEAFVLQRVGNFLDSKMGSEAVVVCLSVLSGLLDNVPLVAGAQGMYSFEQDHPFWFQLAYGAGVGGNILPFGSAAGVAAMSLLPGLSPSWWFRNVTLIAILGLAFGFIPLLF